MRHIRNMGLTLAMLAAASPAHGQSTITVDIGARDPAISPDGSVVALSILGNIFTIPFEGGTASPVTQGATWDMRPAWSPDGTFLAYAARTASGTDLIVRNMATGGVRYLHRAPASIGQIAFSPDGDDVYFVNDLSQYDAHVWRIPVAGGAPEQLTHTQNWHEWSFALHPDGASLIVESGRYDGTDLFAIDLDDESVTRLTHTAAREMSVVLSRDGSRRANVETFDGIDHIVIADGDRSPRRVHTSPFDQKQLAFHPDGRRLLVVAGRRLHHLDVESGSWTAVPFEAQFTVFDDAEDDLVIRDVRVFDGTGDAASAATTVVVRAGRIAEIDPDAEAPAGVPVVDGDSRMLLPGLLDNHLHYWAPHAGADLLAAGVTAVRDPGSAISDAMDYKDAIRLGILAGPDIYAAGPLIDGRAGYHPLVDINIEDPAAAPGLVRSLKAQGVDLLKAYFLLEPDVLAALVAEAKVQGLPVTGHIGVRTSWNEAMDVGIDGFNHIRVWHDFLPLEVQPDGRDETLDSSRDFIARMQADWEQIDPEGAEVTALLTRMAETGTALDPTLFVQSVYEGARDRLSLEQYAAAADAYKRMGVFVRRAVELGVPLLAGTDNVGLFNELEAYAEAGVPNAEILKAATVNGARWLGREDEFGTIQPGRRAHLILVDGDPLADIAELANIDLVVKDGVIVYRR